MECEAAALKTSRRITNSEGAGVSAQQSHFFSAHTRGFRGGYASSRHSFSVSPIASLPGRNAEMQRDAWYSSERDAAELASPEAVGRYAAQRALSRLGSRKIATTQCPVLFESTLAAGLLGGFVQAVSGGSLYRKSSFLLDSLGKMVFPKHIDILEDPFVLRGKGSSPFDEEGVRVAPRKVVQGGRVQGYFLSSYSARKLGMKTTGNAGGSHNLVLTSRRTKKAYMYSTLMLPRSNTSKRLARPPGASGTSIATTSVTFTVHPPSSKTRLAFSHSWTTRRRIPNFWVSARANVWMLMPASARARQGALSVPGLFSRKIERCLRIMSMPFLRRDPVYIFRLSITRLALPSLRWRV